MKRVKFDDIFTSYLYYPDRDELSIRRFTKISQEIIKEHINECKQYRTIKLFFNSSVAKVIHGDCKDFTSDIREPKEDSLCSPGDFQCDFSDEIVDEFSKLGFMVLGLIPKDS